jgi:hypothetical protein
MHAQLLTRGLAHSDGRTMDRHEQGAIARVFAPASYWQRQPIEPLSIGGQSAYCRHNRTTSGGTMSESFIGRHRSQIGILVYVLAVIALSLAIVSFITPTWLERTFDVSPDAGSGETEWGIVVAFAIGAGVLLLLGRRLRTVPAAA